MLDGDHSNDGSFRPSPLGGHGPLPGCALHVLRRLRRDEGAFGKWAGVLQEERTPTERPKRISESRVCQPGLVTPHPKLPVLIS